MLVKGKGLDFWRSGEAYQEFRYLLYLLLLFRRFESFILRRRRSLGFSYLRRFFISGCILSFLHLSVKRFKARLSDSLSFTRTSNT